MKLHYFYIANGFLLLRIWAKILAYHAEEIIAENKGTKAVKSPAKMLLYVSSQLCTYTYRTHTHQTSWLKQSQLFDKCWRKQHKMDSEKYGGKDAIEQERSLTFPTKHFWVKRSVKVFFTNQLLNLLEWILHGKVQLSRQNEAKLLQKLRFNATW